MTITKEDVIPSCQNCDFEYVCLHDELQPCVKWRPDLEYRQMLESCREENKDELWTK